MSVLLVVLVMLSTYRLTRLVTADKITERFRDWANGRVASWPGYLAQCDWCLSIWVAPWPTLAAVWWGDNRAVLAGLVALSASAATGLIATVEQKVDASV